MEKKYDKYRNVTALFLTKYTQRKTTAHLWGFFIPL